MAPRPFATLAGLLLLAAAALGEVVQPGAGGKWSQLYAAPAPAPSPQEYLPDIQIDGVDKVKAWAKERIGKGEQLFGASALPRQASPPTWAGVVIYHLMPDRFNNGNPDNDFLNIMEGQRVAMAINDYSNMPNWRHGGDIKGIKDRLGYLADLGVQVLWITPVLQTNGDYHGYCNIDLTTTDPSFGSPDELRDLVAEAHRHGIYVVLDVVVNHLCDVDTHYVEPADHEACSEHWNDLYWKGAAANYSGVRMNFSSNFFPPFRSEAFFNRCGPNSVADTSGLTAAAIFGDFIDGMFDYNTQNHDWQEIFTNLLKYWVAFADLDGLRLDAAKHVTVDFLAYLSTEMRAYAQTLGKSNFLTIGEEAAQEETWKALSLGKMMSDPEDPLKHGKVPFALTQRLETLKDTYLADPVFPAPGLGSLYNFNMSGSFHDALRCEKLSSTAEAYFTSEARKILMAQSVPQKGAEPDAHLWILIELHDWPRFLGLQPNNEGLLAVALTWLLTSPGAPLLYAGVEQGFNGACPPEIDVTNASSRDAIAKTCAARVTEDFGAHPDSLKRQDMFISGPWRLESAVDVVNRTTNITQLSPTVSTKPWQEDPMLPRDHSLYRHVKRMVAFRRSCPALTQGSTVMHEAAEVKCGFMAYSRLPFENQAAGEVIVLLNPGGGGPIHLEDIYLNGTVNRTSGLQFLNPMNTSYRAEVQIEQDGSQKLSFPNHLNLEEGTSLVMVQEGHLAPFKDSLGIALCKEGADFVAVLAKAEPGTLARSVWYLIGAVAIAIPLGFVIWGCFSKDKSQNVACGGDSDDTSDGP